MAEEYTIGMSISVDDDEVLRKPDEIFEKWKDLNKRLSDTPLFTRAQRELFTEYGSQVAQLGRMQEQQGFLDPNQFRRMQQALLGMGRIGREVFRDLKQEASAATAGMTDEIEQLSQQAQKATDPKERERLQRLVVQKYQEYERLTAAGGQDPRQEAIAQEADAFQRRMRDAQAEARLAKERYPGEPPPPRPQLPEEPPLPEDAQARLREFLEHNRRLMDDPALTESKRALLKDHEARLIKLNEIGAQQGFFSPQQLRTQTRLAREMRGVLRENYADATDTAKRGEERYTQEIKRLQEQRADATTAEERERIDAQLTQQRRAQHEFITREGVARTRQTARRHFRLLGEYEADARLRGQDYQPPDREAPEMGTRLAGGVLNFGRGLIGGAIIGGMAYHAGAKIRQSIRDEADRQILTADLAQRIRPLRMDSQQYQEAMRRLDPSLTPAESTRFVAGYTALAGSRDALTGRGHEAVQLTRAFGFTPEQGAQLFGQAQRMGVDQMRLAESIGERIADAQMRGREGEMFESLIRMSDVIIQQIGAVPNIDAVAGLLGRLSATGVPGLQGAYGAAQLQNINQAVQQTRIFPGVEGIGQLVMFEAMSRMGVSYPEFLRIQEQGIIANPELGRRVFESIEGLGGMRTWAGAEAAQAMRIPLNQYENIKPIFTTEEGHANRAYLERLLGKERVEDMKDDWPKFLAAYNLAAEFRKGEETGLSKAGPSREDVRQKFEERLQAETSAGQDALNLRTTRAEIAQLEATIAERLLPTYRELIGHQEEFIRSMVDTVEGVGSLGSAAKKAADFLNYVAGGQAAEDVHSDPWESVKKGAGWLGRFLHWGMVPPRVEREWATPSLAGYTFTPAPRQEFSPYLDEGMRREMERMRRAPADLSAIPEHAREPIAQAAAKHNVPLPLAAALAKQESGFDPNKPGTSGERGMYQLLPSSFPGYSLAQLDDPSRNADLGVGYLRELYDKYRPRTRTDAEGWSLALTAYNWGMGEIAERTDPSDTAAEVLSKAPSSTQEHQANVLKYAGEFGRTMRAAARETVERPALADYTFTPAPAEASALLTPAAPAASRAAETVPAPERIPAERLPVPASLAGTTFTPAKAADLPTPLAGYTFTPAPAEASALLTPAATAASRAAETVPAPERLPVPASLAGYTFTPAPRPQFSPYLNEAMDERMQRDREAIASRSRSLPAGATEQLRRPKEIALRSSHATPELDERMQRDMEALRSPHLDERMRRDIAALRSSHLDARMRQDMEATASLGQSTPLSAAERRAVEESRLASLNLKVDISPLDIIQRNEAGEPISHHQALLTPRRMTGPRQSVNLRG